MKRFAILPVPLLVLALAVVAVACGGGVGDEREVTDLVKQQEMAFNDEDWYTSYQMMSPNYRATCSYEEYEEFSQEARAMWLALFGPGNVELIDISVRVEGEWAYATYKAVLEGEVLWALTSTTPDIYRKVDGRWYDVAEEPMEPGYNVADLPPEGVSG